MVNNSGVFAIWVDSGMLEGIKPVCGERGLLCGGENRELQRKWLS